MLWLKAMENIQTGPQPVEESRAGEIVRLRRALNEAQAALATVVCRGHYDTCSHALSEEYACSCPWDVAREAIQIIDSVIGKVDAVYEDSVGTGVEPPDVGGAKSE